MSIVRLVIAWLVMAALPLQGLAAASMLFCEQATHSTAVQPASHGHGSHADAGHDHAKHSHDADEHGSAGDHTVVSADDASALDGHSCSVCAACCNLVALAEMPGFSLDADPPAAQPLEIPSRVSSRETSLPDKPPRA